MKKVAVVILNWNGEQLLKQFLPSVIENTPAENVEIVVADNCSTDNSVQILRSNFPQVKLIQLDINFGYAEGYNQALQQIDATYFVLLNSDVEVTFGWLDPIIPYLQANEDVAAVQPKIKSFRNKAYFEYAGAAGGYIDKLGYPFCRGRIFTTLEEDKGQYDTVRDIFWASGACLVIRSKDFFDAGGFDKSFFAHMEEIDLCWRLNARGRRLVCIPQSLVYHVGGATLHEESPRKTFLNFRNNLLMLYKNLPDHSLKSVFCRRRYWDCIAYFKFLLLGKFSKAKAIRQAYKEFNTIKNQYTGVRTENQQKATQTAISSIYTKSILSAYYLHGRKLFSRLKGF